MAREEEEQKSKKAEPVPAPKPAKGANNGWGIAGSNESGGGGVSKFKNAVKVVEMEQRVTHEFTRGPSAVNNLTAKRHSETLVSNFSTREEQRAARQAERQLQMQARQEEREQARRKQEEEMATKKAERACYTRSPACIYLLRVRLCVWLLLYAQSLGAE